MTSNAREVMYLGGPSVNPHWHVPRALHSLEGEIETARKVIELWDPLVYHRIAGNKEHSHELGAATIAVMVTAIIAERALKSLIAQTHPDVKPEQIHGLHNLYHQLDSQQQQELITQFKNLPLIWQRYWQGDDIQEVFQIADSAFVDWRYTMEPRATTGGIPKGVLKAAVAVKLVCWNHLQAWQAYRIQGESLTPSVRERLTDEPG